MATFKVGQRVKRVAHAFDPIPLGSTGTISGPLNEADCCYPVEWDAGYQFSLSYCAHTLAPLTDPDSEWADAKIKELLRPTRDPVELSEDELASVGGGQ